MADGTAATGATGATKAAEGVPAGSEIAQNEIAPNEVAQYEVAQYETAQNETVQNEIAQSRPDPAPHRAVPDHQTIPEHHSIAELLPIRHTARIVLADSRDRILLFRFVDPQSYTPGGVWWGTPGGGVDEGESLSQAAARELFEETGLRLPAESFAPVIAANRGVAHFDGLDRWFENHYFFLRAEHFDLDVSGWEEIERASIAEHRWWSAEELAATEEIVHPPGLARILPDLLAGRLPDEPVEVGWA